MQDAGSPLRTNSDLVLRVESAREVAREAGFRSLRPFAGALVAWVLVFVYSEATGVFQSGKNGALYTLLLQGAGVIIIVGALLRLLIVHSRALRENGATAATAAT